MYYVRKDKLARLERLFRADLRWMKKLGYRFSMKIGPAVDYTKNVWDIAFTGCGCLVAARLARSCERVCREPQNDAARQLGVNEAWLNSMYLAMGSKACDLDDASFPQATRLAHRLRNYAAKIGLGHG